MVKQELTYSLCFFSFMRMVGNFDWDILVYPSKVFVSRFCYYLQRNFNYNNFLKQNLNSIIPTIFWRVISWWFRNSMIFECDIWKKWTNHYPPLFCFSQRKQLLPAKWVSWVSIAIVWSWWNHINGHKVHHVNHDYPILSYETTNILIKPQKNGDFPYHPLLRNITIRLLWRPKRKQLRSRGQRNRRRGGQGSRRGNRAFFETELSVTKPYPKQKNIQGRAGLYCSIE